MPTPTVVAGIKSLPATIDTSLIDLEFTGQIKSAEHGDWQHDEVKFRGKIVYAHYPSVPIGLDSNAAYLAAWGLDAALKIFPERV